MRDQFHTNQKFKLFLYARKSSESEDRQIQSIDDQISRLKTLATQLGIEIKEIFTESKTAKKPHVRPVFYGMLKRIEKGEADGILCWGINRLFRNPYDQGKIGQMLCDRVIKCIQTIDKQYLPEDNVLLFNIEGGMAHQYIIDLRKNCRRGMEGKAERGWKPSMAPVGYKNDKGEKTITVDSKRFKLVRKMWDMMLSGNYTPQQIREIANDEWGFQTLTYKRKGGTPLSAPGIYKLFGNIFYTGMFRWDGKLYQGNHQPMITLKEFDRVQVMLGRHGNPRPQTHDFAYTGILSCSACHSMYTATEKTKLVKTENTLKSYTYYHCTRKKKPAVCDRDRQIPLSITMLEKEIAGEVQKYNVKSQFIQWGHEYLYADKGNDAENAKRIFDMQKVSLEKSENELQNLTRMRYRELIDDDTFIKESTELKDTIARLKYELAHTEDHSEVWDKLTEKTFHFGRHALRTLAEGTNQEKREMLNALGSNCAIQCKKLLIEASEWLIPIGNDYPFLKAEYDRLELENTLTDTERNEALRGIRIRWCSTVEEVRTVFKKLNDPDIKIPPYEDTYK